MGIKSFNNIISKGPGARFPVEKTDTFCTSPSFALMLREQQL